MKTETNPDLDFLRGLRERLKEKAERLSLDSDAYEFRYRPFQSERSDAKSEQCLDITNEITDYLKTRGIE